MTSQNQPTPERWLIVGHGSVGSFLAARLSDRGREVSVLDPAPRLALREGVALVTLEDGPGPFDNVACAVPPASAERAAAALAPTMGAETLFFDWNTSAPATKRRIEKLLPGQMIDVALLDSLDAAAPHPFVAISGSRVEEATAALEGVDFRVAIAGPAVGQAAALKYLRSLFMKTLEALVLEHAAISDGLDAAGIVSESLANNLGPGFTAFSELLIRTNRLHAQRRSAELRDAAALFREGQRSPTLATAAQTILERAAAIWDEESAPGQDAPVPELTRRLRERFWETATRLGEER